MLPECTSSNASDSTRSTQMYDRARAANRLPASLTRNPRDRCPGSAAKAVHPTTGQIVNLKRHRCRLGDLKHVKKDVQPVVYSVAVGRYKTSTRANFPDQLADLRLGIERLSPKRVVISRPKINGVAADLARGTPAAAPLKARLLNVVPKRNMVGQTSVRAAPDPRL